MQNHNFIKKSDVIKIHDKLIEKYGGNPGFLNEGLLSSALSMPEMSFGGELLHPTIVEQAAAYFFHISKNHAFVDGNKRTAFAVMVTFLNLNNYELEISDDNAYRLAIKVVENEVSKED
ncbi:type II toxin-antitoxin system death-on-curing family toxin [Fischerella sp. JS2]|uniref:type II toxin-antitoxin system death-on-curing family toxin n=1 Tax=Fischerella sp. JS2 TaxID=2597771 RepID=UPI0028E88A89|nr:type II toxin-antitoxin system death-on-curing family toxin [Fischerella sp. JS2]